MKVEYRDIPGFPGYRVGSDGSIWTSKKTCSLEVQPWRLKSTRLNDSGYVTVSLRANGKNYERFVHRLILEAFVGPCPKGHEAAHDNGKRTDNRPTNLFWKTSLANAADRARHGTDSSGERNAKAKLSRAQVVEIRKRYTKESITQAQLALEYGVGQPAIAALLRGRSWRRVPGRVPSKIRRPARAPGLIGTSHPVAKFTDCQIVKIRRRYAKGKISQAKLAKEYAVSNPTMRAILRNITWTHLELTDSAKCHPRPRAKLTARKVKSIRSKYAAGGLTQYELAGRFGVGKSTIDSIIRRVTWK